MSSTQRSSSISAASAVKHYDAIVIGAGITGIYQLYRLKQAGLSVRVFEDGGGLGGTWYWNRYPGARFDSESYTYGYSFSGELLQEWSWKEHFSPQPDNLEYLNYVATKFDLHKYIQYDSRVRSATYDEATDSWEIETDGGERARARFLISALGILSAPLLPDIEGSGSFKGETYQTSRWPRDPNGYGGSKDVVFKGKRVGIIGTGATAVQLIPEIARTVGHLTVFQRTPQYCSPLHNSKIDAQTQAKIKASYPEIFKKCWESFGCFLHSYDPRSALEVTPQEREALFEHLYTQPGFAIWFDNFSDIMTNKQANGFISEFIRKKIRQRVKDPKIAEMLSPRDHDFGTRRVPMETGYYEVFNQPNVTLVDINATPIGGITAKGVKTSDKEHELDMLIYATGFDGVTGSFTRIDIQGVGGLKLKDKWADGARTYLGIQSADFPNFLALMGPQAAFCNVPRCSELNVDFVTDMIMHMRDRNYTRVAPLREAEDAWTAHVEETGDATVFATAKSWLMGDNVPGKKRTLLLYAGGAPAYKAKCDEVVAKGYEGFEFR